MMKESASYPLERPVLCFITGLLVFSNQNFMTSVALLALGLIIITSMLYFLRVNKGKDSCATHMKGAPPPSSTPSKGLRQTGRQFIARTAVPLLDQAKLGICSLSWIIISFNSLRLILIFLCGGFLAWWANSDPNNKTLDAMGGQVHCRILSLDKIAFLQNPRQSQRYLAEIISFQGHYPSPPPSGRMMLRLPAQDKVLRYGEIIKVSGALIKLKTENPAEKSFLAHQRNQSIYWRFHAIEAAQIIESPRSILGMAIDSRELILKKLHQQMEDPNNFAIASAMLFGLKSELESSQKEKFRRSGLMHIFAVSGLHIGIIAGLLIILLKVLQVPLFTRYALLPLLLLPYLLMTGLPASAVRAWVMISVWSIGLTLRKPAISLNSLYAAALIILLYDSRQLFLAGFQFSFLIMYAIIGLINHLRSIHRVLDEKLLWGRKFKFHHTKWKHNFLNMLIITNCVFLISLGMNLHLGGSINPFSLIANLFCLSLAPPLMGLIISSLFFESLTNLLEPALQLLAGIAIFSSEHQLRPGYIPKFLLLSSTLVFLASLRFQLRAKHQLLIWSGLPILLLACSFYFKQDHQLCIILTPGHSMPAILLSDAQKSTLINCPDYETARFIEKELIYSGSRTIDQVFLLNGRKSSAAGLTSLLNKNLLKSIICYNSQPWRSAFQKQLKSQSLAQNSRLIFPQIHPRSYSYDKKRNRHVIENEFWIIDLEQKNPGSCSIQVMNKATKKTWSKKYLSSNQLQFDRLNEDLLLLVR